MKRQNTRGLSDEPCATPRGIEKAGVLPMEVTNEAIGAVCIIMKTLTSSGGMFTRSHDRRIAQGSTESKARRRSV